MLMEQEPEASLSPHDFELFAHYYDLDQGGYREDLPLYLDLAQRCGPPIIEFGCGTGRLLIPLAEAGYQVTGVEVAPSMLALAEEKVEAAGLRERVALVRADVRRLALGRQFALGICALNTLMHLPSLSDQLAALRVARAHIRAGGLFALALPNPHACTLPDEQTPLLLEKEMRDPRTGHLVLKLFSQRVDLGTQTAAVTLIYDEVDRAGHVHRTLVPMRMRWLYPYEARLLMEVAGFEIDGMYGSYDLEPFSAESQQMILVGRVP